MAAYFSDFSGNIFQCDLNKQGTGVVSPELEQYLIDTYNIHKKEFVLSERFIVAECRERIINLVESLITYYGNDMFLDDLYLVGPCYKKNRLINGEIKLDYQFIVTGTPYYLGGPNFDARDLEPTSETIHREVQEETYLSLDFIDQKGIPVQNHDVCVLIETQLPLIDSYVRPALHFDPIPIFGPWALNHGFNLMTHREINEMEDKLLSFRRGSPQFYSSFQRHKIAVTVLGDFKNLFHFYTTIVPQRPKPAHFESRSNDLGVILLPLRLIYHILTHSNLSNRGPSQSSSSRNQSSSSRSHSSSSRGHGSSSRGQGSSSRGQGSSFRNSNYNRWGSNESSKSKW